LSAPSSFWMRRRLMRSASSCRQAGRQAGTWAGGQADWQLVDEAQADALCLQLQAGRGRRAGKRADRQIGCQHAARVGQAMQACRHGAGQERRQATSHQPFPSPTSPPPHPPAPCAPPLPVQQPPPRPWRPPPRRCSGSAARRAWREEWAAGVSVLSVSGTMGWDFGDVAAAAAAAAGGGRAAQSRAEKSSPLT
jgi:hypothetical protein